MTVLNSASPSIDVRTLLLLETSSGTCFSPYMHRHLGSIPNCIPHLLHRSVKFVVLDRCGAGIPPAARGSARFDTMVVTVGKYSQGNPIDAPRPTRYKACKTLLKIRLLRAHSRSLHNTSLTNVVFPLKNHIEPHNEQVRDCKLVR